MNETWNSIFENDRTIKENIQESLANVEKNPKRFFSICWILFIQICLAIILLIFSILLPIWILYA